VREVHVPLVRRHIGTFGHEAHVAEGAGFDDLAVVGLGHPVDLAGRAVVDQIEQAREGVAQIEAAPAAVADVEHPLHFRLDLLQVVEVVVAPGDRVAERRGEAPLSSALGWRRFGHRRAYVF